MPAVKPLNDRVVQQARDLAFDPVNRRLVTITPERRIKTSTNLATRDKLARPFLAHLESIAPSNEQWLIIAVGMTDFTALQSNPYQCVPFLGTLEGFVQIGHAVILFEGHVNAFTQVCENADLVIVDDEMIPFLQEDWIGALLGVMRNDYIIRIRRKGLDVLGADRLQMRR